MFLLDDLLLAPIKGLAVVCQKVREAAQEDLLAQEKAILAALAELHQQLDAAQIGDEEFNTREGELLDRLEACQRLTKSGQGTVAEDEPQADDHGM
jgi:hypothetical protein